MEIKEKIVQENFVIDKNLLLKGDKVYIRFEKIAIFEFLDSGNYSIHVWDEDRNYKGGLNSSKKNILLFYTEDEINKIRNERS